MEKGWFVYIFCQPVRKSNQEEVNYLGWQERIRPELKTKMQIFFTFIEPVYHFCVFNKQLDRWKVVDNMTMTFICFWK